VDAGALLIELVNEGKNSPRGVLLTVARRVCDLENLVNEEAIARVGLRCHTKKRRWKESRRERKEARKKYCDESFEG
jgi:hypothetical protein